MPVVQIGVDGAPVVLEGALALLWLACTGHRRGSGALPGTPAWPAPPPAPAPSAAREERRRQRFLDRGQDCFGTSGETTATRSPAAASTASRPTGPCASAVPADPEGRVRFRSRSPAGEVARVAWGAPAGTGSSGTGMDASGPGVRAVVRSSPCGDLPRPQPPEHPGRQQRRPSAHSDLQRAEDQCRAHARSVGSRCLAKIFLISDSAGSHADLDAGPDEFFCPRRAGFHPIRRSALGGRFCAGVLAAAMGADASVRPSSEGAIRVRCDGPAHRKRLWDRSELV